MVRGRCAAPHLPRAASACMDQRAARSHPLGRPVSPLLSEESQRLLLGAYQLGPYGQSGSIPLDRNAGSLSRNPAPMRRAAGQAARSTTMGSWRSSTLPEMDTRHASVLAESSDGIHFQEFEGNPIIAAPPQGMNPEFRDPICLARGGLVLPDHRLGRKGHWRDGAPISVEKSRFMEYRKQLLVGDRETSGVFLGDAGIRAIGQRPRTDRLRGSGESFLLGRHLEDETFTPRTATPRRLELFNHMLSPTPLITADGQVITWGSFR